MLEISEGFYMRLDKDIKGMFPFPISIAILQGVTPYVLLHIYIVNPILSKDKIKFCIGSSICTSTNFKEVLILFSFSCAWDNTMI